MAQESAPPEKFEVLLERLDQIVTEMENGDLPLEKLLASYEEGMRLVKSCGDRLTDAEQKVEILSQGAAKDVARLATPSTDTEVTPEVSESDDIRLF